MYGKSSPTLQYGTSSQSKAGMFTASGAYQSESATYKSSAKDKDKSYDSYNNLKGRLADTTLNSQYLNSMEAGKKGYGNDYLSGYTSQNNMESRGDTGLASARSQNMSTKQQPDWTSSQTKSPNDYTFDKFDRKTPTVSTNRNNPSLEPSWKERYAPTSSVPEYKPRGGDMRTDMFAASSQNKTGMVSSSAGDKLRSSDRYGDPLADMKYSNTQLSSRGLGNKFDGLYDENWMSNKDEKLYRSTSKPTSHGSTAGDRNTLEYSSNRTTTPTSSQKENLTRDMNFGSKASPGYSDKLYQEDLYKSTDFRRDFDKGLNSTASAKTENSYSGLKNESKYRSPRQPDYGDDYRQQLDNGYKSSGIGKDYLDKGYKSSGLEKNYLDKKYKSSAIEEDYLDKQYKSSGLKKDYPDKYGTHSQNSSRYKDDYQPSKDLDYRSKYDNSDLRLSGLYGDSTSRSPGLSHKDYRKDDDYQMISNSRFDAQYSDQHNKGAMHSSDKSKHVDDYKKYDAYEEKETRSHRLSQDKYSDDKDYYRSTDSKGKYMDPYAKDVRKSTTRESSHSVERSRYDLDNRDRYHVEDKRPVSEKHHYGADPSTKKRSNWDTYDEVDSSAQLAYYRSSNVKGFSEARQQGRNGSYGEAQYNDRHNDRYMDTNNETYNERYKDTNNDRYNSKSSPSRDVSRKSSELSRNKKDREQIKVDLSGTAGEVVEDVTRLLGFGLCKNEDPNCFLIWNDSYVSMEKVAELRPYQRINHFTGMGEIGKKDCLARNISKMLALHPKDYAFVPKTWILPDNHVHFQVHCKDLRKKQRRGIFIIKPINPLSDNEIQLSSNTDEIEGCEDVVVQEYIDRPLLLNGHKNHMRIYVLVTSCDPLRAFMYREGFVFFADEKYINASETNLMNSEMHISRSSASTEGHKQRGSDRRSVQKASLRQFNECLKQGGNNVAIMWDHITDLIIKTLLLAQPHMYRAYQMCRLGKSTRDSESVCFEILGFDILIDRELNPWLLEVNRSPSFSVKDELDRTIKSGMIEDALRLLDMRFNDRDRDTTTEKALKSLDEIEVETNKTKEKHLAENKKADFKDMANRLRIDAKSQAFSSNCGQFRQIFPSHDKTSLEKYIKLLESAHDVATQPDYQNEEIQKFLLQKVKYRLERVLTSKKSNSDCSIKTSSTKVEISDEDTTKMLTALNNTQISFPGKNEKTSNYLLDKLHDNWDQHKHTVAEYWLVQLDSSKQKKVIDIVRHKVYEVAQRTWKMANVEEVRLYRIFNRVFNRLLSNHGQGLWECFQEKRGSWETILSKSTEVITPTDLACCRRVVQLCCDCMLVVYKCVTTDATRNTTNNANTTSIKVHHHIKPNTVSVT